MAESQELIKFDNPRKETMLKYIVETGGQITEAAKLAGMDRGNHYYWMKTDPKYKEIYEMEAKEQAADVLEGEVIRRGFKGVDEPVFYQGKQVTTVKRYSDNLLMFMLKGLRPHKFRDNYNPAMSLHAGNISVNLQIPRPEEKAIDAEFKEKETT